MSLKSKIAVITGGASGLGKATSLRFANAGARVVIMDLPSSNGRAIVEQIGADRSLFTPVDVTSESDIKQALNAVVEKFGCPNAVVQCAGIATATRVLHPKKGTHTLDLFQKVMNVNVTGTFNVLRLASELMVASGKADEKGELGCFVHTASVAAFEGQIGQAAYSASKGAIVGMMLPIARELSKYGIRVNTIAPGLFLTPLLEALPAKVQDELAADIPFPKRLGVPDEYAALAQHMVENVYLNGEVVRIDGALRMKP
jgi:3-hydroxyacyl-CoA dehydrogenase/3-hydroxy-2-methylbutyryl-CoA dehydrogenase